MTLYALTFAAAFAFTIALATTLHRLTVKRTERPAGGATFKGWSLHRLDDGWHAFKDDRYAWAASREELLDSIEINGEGMEARAP